RNDIERTDPNLAYGAEQNAGRAERVEEGYLPRAQFRSGLHRSSSKIWARPRGLFEHGGDTPPPPAPKDRVSGAQLSGGRPSARRGLLAALEHAEQALDRIVEAVRHSLLERDDG